MLLGVRYGSDDDDDEALLFLYLEVNVTSHTQHSKSQHKRLNIHGAVATLPWLQLAAK